MKPTDSPSGNDALLGRLAVRYGLINMEQLAEATRAAQGREPGTRLGDVLNELGFLTTAQVERLLGVQRDLLARHRAARATEGAAPDLEQAAAAEPEPARTEAEPAPVADARPARPEPAPSRAAAPEPPVAAAAPPRPAGPTRTPEPTPGRPVAAASARSSSAVSSDPKEIEALLRRAAEAGASDLHVHSGAPTRFRSAGSLLEGEGPALDATRAAGMLLAMLTAEQRDTLDAHGQIDFAYAIPDVGRFRCNVYRQQRGLDGVFRLVPPEPPGLEQLGLPTTLARFAGCHQGMVLLTGPASCGKSSTMAAMVNIINEERSDHILTLEDPIEFVHRSKRCLVNQRQVERHTESFPRALRAALREDPDVIAIGELRDLETIALALSAAETGHFVLATLHTGSAVRTVNRLIGAFPPSQQDQIRTMVSESLRAIVSQRLVPRADGAGRVPALEVLVVSRAVGNLIRESKTFQLPSIMQTGAAQGMCLLDDSLAALVRDEMITREDARLFCDDPKRFPGAEEPS